MSHTIEELDLLIEALAMSASRHESQARFRKPGAFATEHDEKAAAMRTLRVRLMQSRLAEKANGTSA